MPAILGRFALVLALGVALYGAVSSVLAARKEDVVMAESARLAAYSLLVLVAAANAAMLVAILRNDFSIRYVAENSSRETPTFFKILSLWSGDEGSLLLWNLVLAGYISAVAVRFRRRRLEILPWVFAVMFCIAAFYLILVLGPTSPFAGVATLPADGRGPLPLLQNNPLMALHPPFLYLGFIGFTVPFAFAMAALLSGRLSDEWIRITRRWTILAWLCLTTGLALGALWSYRVLGWGGFWAWDPVENVALLPWLLSTAFLHSVIIQERRGMLKVWNLSLIVGTFALTTLATFLTRGSILSSVHSFAASLVGPLYLGFLTVVLLVGFGLIAWRADLLRKEGRIDSALSRESAFLGNNIVLLAMTFVVLLGTIYPLLIESITGRQVSVGGPYFRGSTLPIALVLLLLAGAAPLLPWRVGSWAALRRRLAWPVAASAALIVILATVGVRNLAAIAALSFAAFVLTANLAELARGVTAYRRSLGGTRRSALTGAVARDRRMYGGLIVHLGVALVAVALTASWSFSSVWDMRLTKGQETQAGPYAVRFDGLRKIEQPQRSVFVADISVSRGGAPPVQMHPSMNLYPSQRQPVGSPSIRVGVVQDTYVSLMSLQRGGQTVYLRLYADPGVTWLWIGALVMLAGGAIAGWPPRRLGRRTLLENTPSVREEVSVS